MYRGAGWIRSAPFIRLIIPFTGGILFHYYHKFPLSFYAIIFVCFFFSLLFVRILPLFQRFRFRTGQGIIIFIIFAAFGAMITAERDLRSQPGWLGNCYSDSMNIVLLIKESLSEKAKSFKTTASPFIIEKGKIFPVDGSVIIYFKKDSSVSVLVPGSMVNIHKSLQPIKNSGNPGSFDYRRYCEFRGISHQVYLEPKDFVLLKNKERMFFVSIINSVRKKVIEILTRYIPGRKELGLAEALLIGYKDDLDKELVQSYSNTGVVHVIAISGLHLGLIYGLMIFLLKPLSRNTKLKFLSAVITIIILWLFSIVAGAQASVLRSALMFTCIVIGKNITRQSNIYNTLAFSAFVLLCYQPFWLWDVGFQLSYAAVLSIIIFMKPVYDIFYIKNRLVNGIWKLNAVTISAQILTFPFMLYHFHQFPLGFLLSNLIAVPLSSIILIAEIILCVISFAKVPAEFVGNFITGSIRLMNEYIARIDVVPGTVWNYISINIFQTILLFAVISLLSLWFINRKYYMLITMLVCVGAIIILRSISFIYSGQQRSLIVYNIPKVTTIDLLYGNSYLNLSDENLTSSLFRFHVKPCRVYKRSYNLINNKQITDTTILIRFGTKSIGIVGKYNWPAYADVLIVTQQAEPAMLSKHYTTSFLVITPRVSLRKSLLWKNKCRELKIPYHDVKEKGAFVMNMRDTTFAAPDHRSATGHH